MIMPKTIQKKKLHKSPRMLYSITGILCTALFIAGGFFVPELILDNISNKNVSSCQDAPENYYLASGTAMAKQASEHLTTIDRIKLISGTWDSSYVQVPTDEGTVSEYDIVALAKQKIDYFYNKSVYPYSLESSYANWYSWDTELYKYTDNIFNTYTIYLWVVHFTKYDNSLTHTVLITENGTVLAAEVSDDSRPFSSIKNVYLDQSVKILLGDTSIQIGNIINTEDVSLSGYPFIDMHGIYLQNIYKLELSDKRNEADYYYIYQYKSDGKYGIGIIPDM